MGKKLFVGGLPYETNDLQLKELFAQCGGVLSAKVIIDRETGKSKGFGFVEMSTDDQAKAAILKLNNFTLGTRRIMVNEARPMEPRPAGGYPPRPAPGAPGGFSGPRPGGFGGPRPGGDRNPNFGADSKPFDERKNRYEDKKRKRRDDGEFDKGGKGGGKGERGGNKGKFHYEEDDDGGW